MKTSGDDKMGDVGSLQFLPAGYALFSMKRLCLLGLYII